MVFERTDRSLQAWQVVVFVIIAVALGAYQFFSIGPQIRDVLDASFETTQAELVAAPAGEAAGEAEEEEAGPVEPLDMHYLGYHAGDVPEFVDAMGDDMSLFTGSHMVVDLFLAIALLFALSSAFLFLSNPRHRFAVPLPEGVRLVVISAIFGAVVADLLENVVLWIILGSETPPNSLLYLGGMLTGIKWLGYSVGFAAVVATLILALLRGLSGGGSRTPARA